MNNEFQKIISEITEIGKDWHSEQIVQNAILNKPYIKKSIKNLDKQDADKSKSAIVISAGPSLRKTSAIKKILDTKFRGTIVAVDGAYVACLREGLIPDYVLTLDPHLTRLVRWFGDPDIEENTKNDDYFSRQDLDVDFRKNQLQRNLENIDIVNKFSAKTKLIIATTSPINVTKRTLDAGLDQYWWNPLMDNPNDPGSLTRKLYNINSIPCFNTGGTVGTAAWVFANSVLKIPAIGIVGMDLGYYKDTPYEMTQTYYELIKHRGSKENMENCFTEFIFPLTGEKFYTDPTYYWYRRNFLQLLEKSKFGKTFNCSGGGTLFGDNVSCMTLENFLHEYR